MIFKIQLVGPIGKHYTVQWNEEDLVQQMRESSRFGDLDSTKPVKTAQKRKLNESMSIGSKKAAIASSLLDQSFDKMKKITSPSNFSYGPLTQRLISALIEQNLMTPFDNEIADYLDRISPNPEFYISPRSMAKKCFSSTSSNSHSYIENKIKKTLIEQGILDLDDERNGNATANNDDLFTGASVCEAENLSKNDEIGIQILNVQKELRMVSQHVKQTLLHLVELSRQNIAKQEIKKKIASIDNEVFH